MQIENIKSGEAAIQGKFCKKNQMFQTSNLGLQN